MSRWSIRARILALAGVLLGVVVGTNVYLTHKLADSATAVVEAGELGRTIDAANGARIAFGEMRYWLTDLAVSLLTPSERNAVAARERMDKFLDALGSSPNCAPSVPNTRSPPTTRSTSTPPTTASWATSCWPRRASAASRSTACSRRSLPN